MSLVFLKEPTDHVVQLFEVAELPWRQPARVGGVPPEKVQAAGDRVARATDFVMH